MVWSLLLAEIFIEDQEHRDEIDHEEAEIQFRLAEPHGPVGPAEDPREGQQLDIRWDFLEDGVLRVDAFRKGETKDERILSAKLLFE